MELHSVGKGTFFGGVGGGGIKPRRFNLIVEPAGQMFGYTTQNEPNESMSS
jgi:hypothetical protein